MFGRAAASPEESKEKELVVWPHQSQALLEEGSQEQQEGQVRGLDIFVGGGVCVDKLVAREELGKMNEKKRKKNEKNKKKTKKNEKKKKEKNKKKQEKKKTRSPPFSPHPLALWRPCSACWPSAPRDEVKASNWERTEGRQPRERACTQSRRDVFSLPSPLSAHVLPFS